MNLWARAGALACGAVHRGLRVQQVGGLIAARFWPDAAPEPTSNSEELIIHCADKTFKCVPCPWAPVVPLWCTLSFCLPVSHAAAATAALPDPPSLPQVLCMRLLGQVLLHAEGTHAHAHEREAV